MEQNTEPIRNPTHLRSINNWQSQHEYTMEKDNLVSRWYWESWTAAYKSVKSEYSLSPYTKINSKWIKDLNVRHDTIKLREEKRWNILWCKSYLLTLGQSTKAIEMKGKINKWGLIKLKSFCTAKETINKMSRQPTEREKIFTNDVTDKGFISKIHKQIIQLNNKNNNKKPNQKMGRRPKQTFLQRRHTHGQEAHEKMLNITNY